MPEFDDRLQELRERWESTPGSRVFLQLAEEYRRLGLHPEAIEVLQKGLAASPNHLAAKVALGRCWLELGQHPAAVGELEDVVSKDPTNLVANKLLIEAHLELGQTAKAAERLDLYVLLNDGDPAIELLRARLDQSSRLASVEEPEPLEPETEAAGMDLHPSPFDLPPVQPAPAPTELTANQTPDSAKSPFGGANPFGDLVVPVDSRAHAAALGAEGIFQLELPSEPSVVEPAHHLEKSEPPAAAPVEVGEAPFEVSPEPHLPEQVLPVEALSEPEALLPVQALPGQIFDLGPPAAEPAPALALFDLEPRAEPEPSVSEDAPLEEPQPEPAPTAASEPTATLGNLYLEQGHLDEAEGIFRRILLHHPEHGDALAGMAEIERRREPIAAPEPLLDREPISEPEPIAASEPVAFVAPPEIPAVEAGRLTARDLLTPDEWSGASQTRRKTLVLERYLDRLRRKVGA